ncbi:MAG: prohibitin family protein [Melioribacteraceae bacterium]|nr:prohibitin family protein [Melioribacteraceae bacterium]
MNFIMPAILAIVAFIVFVVTKKNNKNKESFISLLIGLVMAVIAFVQFVTVVPAGTVGVVDFFGTVSDQTLRPGVNIVNPLATIHKFDQKTQTITASMSVPSKEGLSVGIDVSILYKLDESKANEIYKTVGIDFVNKILVPNFRSIVRDVTAKYEAKDLYTSLRDQISDEIAADIRERVAPRGIIVESVPIRGIKLPSNLMQSIEAKLQAEQESQKMAFVLQKERQEAERKSIEAKGISDFQTIVSKGISDQLLKWKGIEATEKLASSPNSKVIVIGSGKDGLPIILGNN